MSGYPHPVEISKVNPSKGVHVWIARRCNLDNPELSVFPTFVPVNRNPVLGFNADKDELIRVFPDAWQRIENPNGTEQLIPA